MRKRQLTAEDEIASADDPSHDRMMTATGEQLATVDHVPASNRVISGRRHDRVFAEGDASDAAVMS